MPSRDYYKEQQDRRFKAIGTIAIGAVLLVTAMMIAGVSPRMVLLSAMTIGGTLIAMFGIFSLIEA